MIKLVYGIKFKIDVGSNKIGLDILRSITNLNIHGSYKKYITKPAE
jgi:hypothetical protein